MLTNTMQVTSGTVVRMAVFGSGTGTNAEAIIQKGRETGVFDVVLVVSSRANVGLIEVAERYGVAVEVVPGGSAQEAEAWMLEVLDRYHVDIIALAGYLRLIPGAVVSAYEGRMFNVHPSLLPRHGGPGMYGIRVHESVVASGDRVTGATVHRVSREYDEGEIIGFAEVDVGAHDDAHVLQEKVKKLEHTLYPAVLERVCRDRNF
jgi:phosphoribosylglycinamide formyltransferase-1